MAAIVGGFVFIGALSFGFDAVVRATMPNAFDASGGTSSVPVLLMVIGYVAIAAIAGCYLCARLAPSRPMRHALILGVLGLLFNIAGTWQLWNSYPAWYHAVSLLLVLPYAWLGGWLRERELARGGARPSVQVA
ncbi:MAG TPA: hypothetical protein VGD77_15605 [Gemmatimonadaceae bacterium]